MGISAAPPYLSQCTVVNIDDSSQAVTAFYNPNKIKISKSVPWQGHASAHGHAEVLEFTGAKNQTLSVDLFFDGYESQEDVSVHINTLMKMTEATVPISEEEKRRMEEAMGQGAAGRPANSNAHREGLTCRPPFVMFVWGKSDVFKGVISSLNTEYNFFLHDGTRVRATCSLGMTEVHISQMLKRDVTAAEMYRTQRVRNRRI